MPDRLVCRVADHGMWFATRSQARRVRIAALDMLATREDVDSLVLDFAGVEAITNGCADEMVANLIVQQDDRSVFVTGANHDVWEAITTALARRRLAALPEETTTDG